jgi:hypothetical protein
MSIATPFVKAFLVGALGLALAELGAVELGAGWALVLVGAMVAGAAWPYRRDPRWPSALPLALGLALLATVPFEAAPALAAILLALGFAGCTAPLASRGGGLAAVTGAVAACALTGAVGGADRLAAGALVAMELLGVAGGPPRRLSAWVGNAVAVTAAVVVVVSQPVSPRTLDAFVDLGLEPMQVSERWEPFRRVDRVVGPNGAKDLWTLVDGAAPVPDEAGLGPFESTRRHILLDVTNRLAEGRGVTWVGWLPNASPATDAAPVNGVLALASTHIVRDGQPVTSVDAPRLQSRAAFEHAWNRLGPDGLLVWIANDEAVFLRGLFVLAGILEEEGRPPLPGSGWAVRLTEDADSGTPYRWMVVLPKGEPLRTTLHRLRSLEEAEVGRMLFGFGVETKDRFRVFLLPGGFERSRERTVAGFGRRLGYVVEPSSTPSGDGEFFRLSGTMSVAERGLTGAGALLALWLGLVSLGRRRHVDSADAGNGPPVPVLLGAVALPGAGAGLAMAVALRRAAVDAGALFPDVPVMLLLALGGFVLLRAGAPRRADPWIGVVFGLLGGLALAAGDALPADVRVLGVAVVPLAAVLACAAGAALLARGTAAALGPDRDDVRRSAMRSGGLAFGLAMLLVEVPGFTGSPDATALAAAAAFLAGAMLALWTAHSGQSHQRM